MNGKAARAIRKFANATLRRADGTKRPLTMQEHRDIKYWRDQRSVSHRHRGEARARMERLVGVPRDKRDARRWLNEAKELIQAVMRNAERVQ